MTQMRIRTTLTSVNNTIDSRGAEIIRLLKLYIPEFLEVYYGHRPIGAEDIKFPCAMVEPMRTEQKLTTTGIYDIYATYNVYFYFLNSNRDGLVNIATDAMECLTKLFSNNALNDLNGAHSCKYKTNPGFWIDSEMMQAEISPSFKWAKDEQPLYCRAGLFVLQVFDRQIK
jgi:hypothetical protein